MAHSFLVFDFGRDEDVAQQARHKIEGWKQGYRLDKKLQLKFERKELEAKAEGEAKSAGTGSKAKPGTKSKVKSKSGDETGQDSTSIATPSEIRMIVRLDFSDHEKLSHQRWVERIPGEDLFKTAKPKLLRKGDTDFDKISDLFDSLE